MTLLVASQDRELAALRLELGLVRVRIAELEADARRLDYLNALTANPSDFREGVTICTKWPDGTMLINPHDVREAIDILSTQHPRKS